MSAITLPKILKGGCLCGSIRYEITTTPGLQGLCYCTDCRKSSGSAFVAFMSLPAQDFKLVAGKPRLFINKSISGGERAINFCENCGAHLFGGVVGKDDEHTIYAGSLDSEFIEDFVPKIAIFTKCRPAWGKLESDLKEFETM
ncbi:glutathione-dependent formaldehyde-activating protein [Tothia fuscella]|uniref:Glutathione-dependent formaldehyde-activating protein n=1 Tax=Tothia fuscella TaxID=1048955 RepID=A0A9P4P018_9PEZI|nr:glutathione-dependent formaldehyde-activating protein [Tothia fuscella]